MWKTLLPAATVAVTLALAGPAMAQTFKRWDTNDNGSIDSNEFQQGFARSGAYSQWDTNNDGVVDQQEFSNGVFSVWDRNGDGQLERQEFQHQMPRNQ